MADAPLTSLLAGLAPVRRPGRYVFVTVPEAPTHLDVVALVREEEGTTLVLAEEVARAERLPAPFVAAMITLGVDSDLAAVGLSAAVTGALAEAGIACNVIAGYHHDHLFVPVERADEAMTALDRLAAGVKSGDVT